MQENKSTSDLSKYIRFSRMSADDINEYTSWFDDNEIKRRMFKPNAKWIEYVNSGNASVAWGVHFNENLVAHIQSESYQDGSYSIAIAVNPTQRRKGYSSLIINKFVNEILKTKDPIFAFIEQDNHASMKAFERAGFIRMSDQPDEDGILKFGWNKLP